MNDKAIEKAARAIAREQEGSDDNWVSWIDDARLAIEAYVAVEIERLCIQLTKAQANLEASELDAERYRWLRDKRISGGRLPCLASYSGRNGFLPVLRECWQSSADVDAAIDLARGR